MVWLELREPIQLQNDYIWFILAISTGTELIVITCIHLCHFVATLIQYNIEPKINIYTIKLWKSFSLESTYMH